MPSSPPTTTRRPSGSNSADSTRDGCVKPPRSAPVPGTDRATVSPAIVRYGARGGEMHAPDRGRVAERGDRVLRCARTRAGRSDRGRRWPRAARRGSGPTPPRPPLWSRNPTSSREAGHPIRDDPPDCPAPAAKGEVGRRVLRQVRCRLSASKSRPRSGSPCSQRAMPRSKVAPAASSAAPSATGPPGASRGRPTRPGSPAAIRCSPAATAPCMPRRHRGGDGDHDQQHGDGRQQAGRPRGLRRHQRPEPLGGLPRRARIVRSAEEPPQVLGPRFTAEA